jgi:hypothetical protein
MDDFAAFADLAARVCAVVRTGPEVALQPRVEALANLLPQLHVAGRTLPVIPEVPEPPAVRYADDWPGLGRFDADAAELSGPLLAVVAWLQAGVIFWEEGDANMAVTVWAGGWVRWSTAVVGMLVPLHKASLRFRPEPDTRRGVATAAVVMLGPGAERVPTGVAAPAPAVKPALGVRFEAIGLGAWVREVHENSPAAGMLQQGDVVLEVDGMSLEHIDPGVLASRMVGPVGVERVYVVYRDGDAHEVRFASVTVEALRGS